MVLCLLVPIFPLSELYWLCVSYQLIHLGILSSAMPFFRDLNEKCNSLSPTGPIFAFGIPELFDQFKDLIPQLISDKALKVRGSTHQSKIRSHLINMGLINILINQESEAYFRCLCVDTVIEQSWMNFLLSWKWIMTFSCDKGCQLSIDKVK